MLLNNSLKTSSLAGPQNLEKCMEMVSVFVVERTVHNGKTANISQATSILSWNTKINI